MRFSTFAPENEDASSSIPLRCAQNDSKDRDLDLADFPSGANYYSCRSKITEGAGGFNPLKSRQIDVARASAFLPLFNEVQLEYKQAAEKRRSPGESPEKLPSEPKGRVDCAQLAARVNSCPFKTRSFSATCKAHAFVGCFRHD
jgi:hypothetical protein